MNAIMGEARSEPVETPWFAADEAAEEELARAIAAGLMEGRGRGGVWLEEAQRRWEQLEAGAEQGLLALVEQGRQSNRKMGARLALLSRRLSERVAARQAHVSEAQA